jgi:pSer/pThr/pTyr-binding forkhead associated (FHA) protein
VRLAFGMSTQAPIRPASIEGITERFDAIACLDERVRRQATPVQPAEPGCYIEVEGPEETLLIPLGRGVMHIGRGIAADLRLDESSVSRRHAILVPRRTGARVLDDRSSNGTFVNGRRVSQADLRNGDVLVLGRVVLRYLEVQSDEGRSTSGLLVA